MVYGSGGLGLKLSERKVDGDCINKVIIVLAASKRKITV